MKSRYPKVLALLISAVFILSIIVGCGAAPSADSQGSSAAATVATAAATSQEAPAATQAAPTTLKMFIRERWAGVSYDNFETHYIEDKTNTKWEMTIAPGDTMEEKLNVLLASGERPDVIQFGSDSMEMKLVKAGMLYPISKDFDKAPNLEKWGEPIWDAMRYPDGNVYSFATDREVPPVGFINIYRKDWLDKLGLQVPQTLDEYYNVAMDVTTKDPDGNGKNDTYAFGSYGTGDLRNFDHIFGAYGALPSQWLDVDGHLINSTVAPGAKEALKFLNKLYKAGVIDPEFVTDNEDRYKTKFMKGIYGAMHYKIFLFDSNNIFNYYKPFHDNNPTAVLIEGPVLQGGSDKPLGPRILSQRGWLKTAAMKESKNIDAVLRVFDWLATDEGAMFVNYGVEGEDYTMDNGVVKMLANDEQIKQRGITQCYLAMTEMIKHTSLPFQKVGEYATSIATADPGDGILVDEVKYQEDLDNYRKSQYAKMIVGELPIDQGFDTFVKDWNKRGGEALTKAVDAVYQQRKAK